MLRFALALAFSLVAAGPAFPQTATVTNLAGGTPGSGGVPVLGFDGAPIIGHPFGLQITHARANSIAVIGVGLSHQPLFDPAFGATVHPSLPLYTLGILATDWQGNTPTFLAMPTDLVDPVRDATGELYGRLTANHRDRLPGLRRR